MSKKELINFLFFIVLCSVFPLFSMEDLQGGCDKPKESVISQELEGNHKKRKRSRRRGKNRKGADFSQSQINLNNIRQINLSLLFSSNKFDELYLLNLQKFASMLILHENIITVLENLGKLVPEMKRLQHFRQIEGDNFVRFLMTNEITNELNISDGTIINFIHLVNSREKEKLCTVKMKENKTKYFSYCSIPSKSGLRDTEHLLCIKTPEGRAATLVLGRLLYGDGKRKVEDYNLVDRVAKNKHPEVKLVTSMIKHYLYCLDFGHCIAREIPYKIFNQYHYTNGKAVKVNNVNLTEGWSNSLPIINLLKKLPGYYVAFEKSELILQHYLKGEDCTTSIAVDESLINLARNIRKFCKKFTSSKSLYNQLYKQVVNEINKVILYLVRKKKSSRYTYKKNLTEKFKVKNVALFCDTEEIKKKINPEYTDELPNVLYENTLVDHVDFQKTGPNAEQQIENNSNKQEVNEVKATAESNKKKKEINSSRDTSLNKSEIFCVDKSNLEKLSLHNLQKKQQTKNQNNEVQTYDDFHVLRWFDKALEDKKVINATKESKLYHSFSLLADEYIFKLGIQTPWQNKTHKGQVDINYSLGGEIKYQDGSNKIVVFTCCKDPKEICYHRGYTVKENNSLFGEYFAKNYWEINFSPLDKVNREQNIPKIYEDKDLYGSYIESEDDLCVKIWDNKNKVTIILYKPCIIA